ncbi:BTAD domain-containing putative transcriptional regulator [Dyella sp. BiH032]|uniref:AAA family ATPase n=1 Tax=Dyella sp. BiH032 TaxID=3075430 RepID=UPI0028935FE7|nr:AAA family ATPase [Dyella sp. BiH032]WNL46438.1 BTAD domain-containing putative transcriptional regulator [Dyella sp. BiH032]
MPHTEPGTRLWVLGGWRLETDGVATAGPSYRKGRGLLAYLALEEGWHAREKLGELFAVGSAGYLRQLVSNLRASLDEAGLADGLVAERNLLRLDPAAGLWVDARAFLAAADERLTPSADTATVARVERCAALYRGEFLHGLSLPDGPEFEAWMEVRRQHMLQQALVLLDRLRVHREEAGLLDRALDHARRILELDPWNEAAHRHVMRLLALSGRTPAALAHYETCRWTLERELGLAPEAETQRLHALIRGGELATVAAPVCEPPVKAMAERRLATLLCCELEVPGEDDVDAIAEALAQPRLRIQSLLAAASGHRVALHGNRLLACFGVPLARENAAQQAVRTALSLMGQLDGGITARIGIHTGIVITHAQSDEADAAGVASGQAIRLAGRAARGEVVVSEATQHLVRGYVHLRPCAGAHDAGVDAMPAFRVEGETGADNRLDSASSLSRLVGREEELAALYERWHAVARGGRSSLLIRGDAGIGKSRLARGLRERLAGESVPAFELRCLPEFSDTPLHPLRVLFATCVGLDDGDAAPQRLDKVAGFVRTQLAGRQVASQEATLLLADLLHAGDADADGELQLAPLKRREKTMRLLLDLLDGLARDRPALLIVEDLHWCDPSTLDVLAAHAKSSSIVPMLTLLTSRPGIAWPHADAVLDLPPLSDAQAMALAQQLATALSAEALGRIVMRCDGIPLYVEEMARMHAQAATTSRTPETSLSLQELLAARLDSRGHDAKATAQLAAALGRDFSLPLLQCLSPLDRAPLKRALDALEESGLILATGSHTYQFKHALIQDAAYTSLTRGGRAAHHRRIARALQSEFSALVESQPEVLARHLALAGEAAAAIAQWLEAGRWAARRSADREAARHFEAGLALLPQLSDERERTRWELALQLGLGSAHVAVQGYGSPEARQAFLRAVALSHDIEDDAAAFPVIFGLWQGGFSERVTAAPLELVERLDRIAGTTGDPFHRLVVDYAYGNNLFWLGRHADAARHLASALAAPAEVQGGQVVARYGEDARNLSRCFLAWTLWFQGRADAALRHMAAALEEARHLGHSHSLAFALTFAAQLQRHLGDAEKTERLTLELARLADEHAMSLWSAVATGTLGWARAVRGDDTALAGIRASIDAALVAMPLAVVTFRSFLTDALIRLGRHAEALACLEDTIARAEAYEDRYMLPEFLRQQAACTVALDPSHGEEAQALLLRALALAHTQGALMLELRIAADLFLLSGSRDAHAALQCAFARCETERGTPDLLRAAGLLGGRWPPGDGSDARPESAGRGPAVPA